MIRRRIHSTVIDSAIAQPHKDQGSPDEDFLEYVPEEPIEQPKNSLHPLSSLIAATGASMWFSTVPAMDGSAIASSSQPVPCGNGNSNDSTNITNITSVEQTGFDDGSMSVEGAMSVGGYEWCQWSDSGFPWGAIILLVSSIYHSSSTCDRTDSVLKSDLKSAKS